MSDIYTKVKKICEENSEKIAYIQLEANNVVEISYYKFLEYVENLIKELKELNLPPKSMIGVNIRRSYQVCAYVVVCSALDFVYVPLDVDYPDEYIANAIQCLNINLLVKDKTTEVLSSIIDRIPKECRFIYFTSGTTGTPKGVMHSEVHFLEQINWMQNIYPFTKDEIMGQRSYISTIPSEWDLFGAFFSGNTTIFIPDMVLQDINTFAEFVNKYKISRLTVNPTILRFWRKYKISNDTLSSLKYVISLGEKMDNILVESIVRDYSFILLDDYGSTETGTLVVTEYSKSREPHKSEAPYYELIVEDSELIVKGENLFIGYKGEDNHQIRYYRTGDIVFKQEDGKFEIEGRKDDIVKISGKRVNKKLVEKYLKEVCDGQEIAVISVKSNSETELHAVLVDDGNQENFVEMRQRLMKKIPKYMVPVSFHVIRELPKLPNGKINYKKLSEQISKGNSNLKENSDYIGSIKGIMSEMVGEELEGKLLDSKFSDIGLDSVRIMETISRLKDELGIEVGASDFYNYETPRKFLSKMSIDLVPEIRGKTSNHLNDKIVIVGASGRFANYSNLNDFYLGLKQGITSFYEDERLGLERIYSKKYTDLDSTYVKYGGFLKTWNKFQGSIFGINTREASLMDPQQRFILMETENLFRQVGFNKNKLFDNNIGVFIGADESNFRQCIKREYRNTDDAILGNLTALIANKISYYFNLNGPSMMLNTACSSSLVAVVEAVGSIQRGECNLAIAGGVSIHMTKDYFVDTSRLNIFSHTEKQRTFSDEADGFLSGEGGAVILLTTESYARNNSLPILACIKGVFSNQDGSSNGITAPNGKEQINLLRSVLKQSGLSINDITAVECHGTGTRLGDLIELSALDTVFKNRSEELIIGSLKSNIGHLNAAAGIASLVKCLLCLNNKELVVTPNAYPLNKLFSWENSKLKVLESYNRPCENSSNYMVNSFGIGGTNATCILEGTGETSVSFENYIDLGDNIPLELLELGNSDNRKLEKENTNLYGTKSKENIRETFMSILEKQLNIPSSEIDFSKSLRDITESSLKIMNVRFAIKEELGQEISLKEFFSNQSLDKLASLLDTSYIDIDMMSDDQILALFQGEKDE